MVVSAAFSPLPPKYVGVGVADTNNRHQQPHQHLHLHPSQTTNLCLIYHPTTEGTAVDVYALDHTMSRMDLAAWTAEAWGDDLDDCDESEPGNSNTCKTTPMTTQ
jgi:hypothetical protein